MSSRLSQTNMQIYRFCSRHLAHWAGRLWEISLSCWTSIQSTAAQGHTHMYTHPHTNTHIFTLTATCCVFMQFTGFSVCFWLLLLNSCKTLKSCKRVNGARKHSGAHLISLFAALCMEECTRGILACLTTPFVALFQFTDCNCYNYGC